MDTESREEKVAQVDILLEAGIEEDFTLWSI